MKISVVVPAFNEERLLPGSLSSIRAGMQGFDRLGWKSELIVCDNNSTDRTAEIAIAAGAAGVFQPGKPQRPRRPPGGAPRRGGLGCFLWCRSFFLPAALFLAGRVAPRP